LDELWEHFNKEQEQICKDIKEKDEKYDILYSEFENYKAICEEKIHKQAQENTEKLHTEKYENDNLKSQINKLLEENQNLNKKLIDALNAVKTAEAEKKAAKMLAKDTIGINEKLVTTLGKSLDPIRSPVKSFIKTSRLNTKQEIQNE